MKKQVIIIVAIVIVVIGLGYLLFTQDQKTAALRVEGDKGAEQAGEAFPELARTHIDPGTPHDPYNSNPPTSGPHWAQPANWGVYDQPLVDEQAVHNLEHGGIWIAYKPNIDAEIKLKLDIIAKANPGSVIMSPREANEAPVALVSWTRLEKMDGYDEAKILNFIKSNKNKSPEPLAN